MPPRRKKVKMSKPPVDGNGTVKVDLKLTETENNIANTETETETDNSRLNKTISLAASFQVS